MNKVTQLLELAQIRKQALGSFYGWYKYMQLNSDLAVFEHDPAEHHKVLMSVGDKIISGEITNLILTMPFGAGKSWLFSQLFPMFFQAVMGGRSMVLNLAGSERLQLDFNRIRRRIAQHPAYVALNPNLAVRPDEANVMGFAFEGGGAMRAFSCEGAILGQRARLQIGDDLIPNIQYVRNPDRMRDLNEKLDTEWYSRHTLGNQQLSVGTTFSINDPMEQMKRAILKGEAEGTVYDLPFECTHPETDLLGRALGEPMFDELYKHDINTRNKIKALRKTDPAKFKTHYQCQPAISEGQWIGSEENFIVVDEKPKAVKRRICMDVALGETTKSDYTVLAVVGIDAQRNFWVEEVWRYRKGINYTIKLLFEIMTKYPDCHDVAIEDDGYSKSLMNSAREYAFMKQIKPLMFNVVKIKGRGKEERATPLRNLFLEQRVRIVRGQHLAEIKHECLGFPALSHDDIVDALAVGAQLLPLTAGYAAPETVTSQRDKQAAAMMIKCVPDEGNNLKPVLTEDGKVQTSMTLDELWGKKGGKLSIMKRRY